MPERIQLTGPPEQAAAQLWAHIQEKTMLNGEHLPKFDSPEKAADVYLEHLTREELEKVIKDLITTLQKCVQSVKTSSKRTPRSKTLLASLSKKKFTCNASSLQPSTP